MTIGLRDLAARLQGHRQWTDAVLLWQATEHGGVLVTFDSGVKTLAQRDAVNRVMILKRS
jgi:predicted nucleic acid-binding protein